MSIDSVPNGKMEGAITPASQDTASGAQLLAWMSLAFSVIQSLATSALRRNEADYQRFSQELLEVLDHLKADTSPASVLLWADKLPKTIERYHLETQRFVNASTSELQGIIHVLLSAVDQMQVEYEGTAGALEEIEDKISNTQTIEDLAIAREHLTQSLRKLAKAARTRKHENSQLMSSLQERILILEKSPRTPDHPAEKRVVLASTRNEMPAIGGQPASAVTEMGAVTVHSTDTPPAMLDSLTGLPNREAAENAIITLKENPAGIYLASFYIRNMRQLNLRFGDKICDEVLFLFAQRIANDLLRSGDQVFRWRGPAFLALVKREENLNEVKREVQRFLRSQSGFEFRSGALVVFISPVADVFSGEAAGSAELVQAVEKFFLVPYTRSD